MTLSTLTRLASSACLVASLLAVGTPAFAQHRARLSHDLVERLAAGDQQMDVIVHGSAADVAALARQYGVRVKRTLASGAVLDVNAGQLAALRDSGAVDHLSADAAVRASADVTRETIGADQLWAASATNERDRRLSGRGITVAVIDSGVDFRHATLANRILTSVDFTGGNGRDGYGHGTHVASLIAGAAATQPDYVGIATGARIVSLRVLDDTGAGKMSDVVEAIDWAIANRQRFGIDVINLSLGGAVTSSYKDDPLCEAAERAVAAGITVVAAAGNFGQTPDGKHIFGGITTPGNDPAVISVGALDTRGTAIRSDDRIAKFSSRGPTMYDQIVKPDLVAPGTYILSTRSSKLAPNNFAWGVYPPDKTRYFHMGGTSMATPLVAGAVAAVREFLRRKRGIAAPSAALVRALLARDTATASALARAVLLDRAGRSLDDPAWKGAQHSLDAHPPGVVAGLGGVVLDLHVDPHARTCIECVVERRDVAWQIPE